MSTALAALKAPLSLSFRPMTPADIPEVENLARKIWREYYPGILPQAEIDYMQELFNSAAALTRQVEEMGYVFLLMEVESAITGYAAVKEEAPGEYYISKFYVDTGRHRLGLGRALMQEVIRRFHPRALTLCVARVNCAAINFYFSQGFRISKTRITDIGNGIKMDDFLMKREIP